MNEPAVKMEEQIINLFQEAETEVYEGWVLKTLGSRLIVFPLYNVYPDNMDERIRACERLGNEKSAECMFRIAENTNFYLHSCLEKIDIYSGSVLLWEICPLRRKQRIGSVCMAEEKVKMRIERKIS